MEHLLVTIDAAYPFARSFLQGAWEDMLRTASDPAEEVNESLLRSVVAGYEMGKASVDLLDRVTRRARVVVLQVAAAENEAADNRQREEFLRVIALARARGLRCKGGAGGNA
jgi:hypothetical protein